MFAIIEKRIPKIIARIMAGLNALMKVVRQMILDVIVNVITRVKTSRMVKGSQADSQFFKPIKIHPAQSRLINHEAKSEIAEI
ncbi:MAG TPA: hypothetical protein VE978_10690 [Chitinophagales bacterium]|nr:hypothetical protein [Chitinophagales bacterium]